MSSRREIFKKVQALARLNNVRVRETLFTRGADTAFWRNKLKTLKKKDTERKKKEEKKKKKIRQAESKKRKQRGKERLQLSQKIKREKEIREQRQKRKEKEEKLRKSAEKALRASKARIERELKESEEKFEREQKSLEEKLDELDEKINIDFNEFNRVNDFSEFRVSSNANSLEGLFVSIQKVIEEKEDIPYVTLFLQDKQRPDRIRYITINSDYLDDYNDFIERLELIKSGNLEGSGAVDDEQYDLILNRFDAIFVNPLEAGCGLGKDFLCKIIKLKASGKNTCIKDSMKHFGYEIPDNIKSISALLEYVREEKLNIHIYQNKIRLTKKFTKVFLKKKPKFYDIAQPKTPEERQEIRDKKEEEKRKRQEAREEKKRLKEVEEINKLLRQAKTLKQRYDGWKEDDKKSEKEVNELKTKVLDKFKKYKKMKREKEMRERKDAERSIDLLYDDIPEPDEVWEPDELDFEDSEMIYVPKKKKPKKRANKTKVKLAKLDPDEYRLFSNNADMLFRNKLNLEEEKAGVLIYSMDMNHIAPMKCDIIDENYAYTDNRGESHIKHMKQCINTENRDDLYISSKKEIYILNSEHKAVLLLSYEKIREYMWKGYKVKEEGKTKNIGALRESKCQHRYLFIDYETVIDWGRKEVMIPYSLSVLDLNKTEMQALEHFDELYDSIEDLYKNCSPGGIAEFETLRSKAKTYVGYDCTYQMMNYIDKQCKNEPQYTVTTFNGSYFDNLILLGDLLKNKKYADKISDIFYTNNMLRNFKIYGRHEMFDLNRHCSGRLKYNCESYKIKLFKKKEFDHIVAQRYYDTERLDDMLNKSNNDTWDEDIKNASDEQKKELKKERKFMNDLIEYNDYDVLSLAVLYSRYEKAIVDTVKKSINESDPNKDHPDFQPYTIELRDFKTIGSLAYKSLSRHWGNIGIELPKFYVSKPASKKTKADFELEKRLYKYYKDIQKYKTAGRVQLFNGIQKYLGRARSLDITSSYPYSMAVNKVYYPLGDVKECENYGERKPEEIGWFYCDINQKVLRDKGLPNLIAEKTGIENIWKSEKLLLNYFIPTVMIDKLIEYGLTVGEDLIIKKGIIFTHKIKNYELFTPLLHWMKVKNGEDKLKQQDKENKAKLISEGKKEEAEKYVEKYNPALRATAKLLSNTPSGKIIERIHIDKISEVRDGLHYHTLKNTKGVSKMNTINVIGNKIFCSYTVNEEHLMYKHRPVYFGVLVYCYSQLNLYENTMAVAYNMKKDPKTGREYSLDERIARQIEYRKGLFLCDTDATKMNSACADLCLKHMKNTIVPHWEEVEKYDERYKTHKMFNPNSKVFGAFEDEFSVYNNINYYLAKKHYGSFFNPNMPHEKPENDKDYNKIMESGDKSVRTLDFHFKGVSKHALVLDDHLIDKLSFIKKRRKLWGITDMRKAFHYYNNKTIQHNTKVSGLRAVDYFDRLSKRKTLNILCQSFRKQTTNLKHDVDINDHERMNNMFNTIAMSYTVKSITL